MTKIERSASAPFLPTGAHSLRPEPNKPPHCQGLYDDLNGEDLACLGLRRVSDSDFFAEDHAERQAEWMRALALPNGFKPTADRAKPRRKPSIGKQIAAAERGGKRVTSITTPDGLTLHFDKTESTEASNPWLDDLKVTKQ